MKTISLITIAAGLGILYGYYLETDNPQLTTGLVITLTGLFIAAMSLTKTKGR